MIIIITRIIIIIIRIIMKGYRVVQERFLDRPKIPNTPPPTATTSFLFFFLPNSLSQKDNQHKNKKTKKQKCFSHQKTRMDLFIMSHIFSVCKSYTGSIFRRTKTPRRILPMIFFTFFFIGVLCVEKQKEQDNLEFFFFFFSFLFFLLLPNHHDRFFSF